MPEPGWEQVQVRRDHYAPWTDDHVEFDTAVRSVGEIAEDIITLVRST